MAREGGRRPDVCRGIEHAAAGWAGIVTTHVLLDTYLQSSRHWEAQPVQKFAMVLWPIGSPDTDPLVFTDSKPQVFTLHP